MKIEQLKKEKEEQTSAENEALKEKNASLQKGVVYWFGCDV